MAQRFGEGFLREVRGIGLVAGQFPQGVVDPVLPADRDSGKSLAIAGRGTVVTGRIERGIVKVSDEIEIVGIKPTQKTVVTGVEMFRKLLDQG